MVTEAQHMQAIIALAKLLDWLCYHTWSSIHSPKGYPDLTLCRPPRVIIAEVKSDKGKLTEAQSEWLDALRGCPGVEVYLWRPGMWDEIEAVLIGEDWKD